MYHGRFGGTHYEAGFKYGAIIRKHGADFDFLCALIFSMYAYDCGTHCSCFAYHDGEKTVFGRNSDFLVSIEKLYMNVL